MKKIEIWVPEKHERTIWVCGYDKVYDMEYDRCILWEDGGFEVVYSEIVWGEENSFEFEIVDGKIQLYDNIFFSKEEAEKHLPKRIEARKVKYAKEQEEKELKELKRLQEKYGSR